VPGLTGTAGSADGIDLRMLEGAWATGARHYRQIAHILHCM
jgi:hypothetical protein